MATLLDGKKVAAELLEEVRTKVAKFAQPPKLIVVMVGENPASSVYVRKKKEAAQEVGIHCEIQQYPVTISQQEILEVIEKLNTDTSVTGIIVQLPLPEQLHVPQIIRAISPKKDVDGFHAYNLGKMFLSPEFEDLPPATPAGILHLLQAYDIELQGLNAVVIGHSNIVGKPVSTMLLNRNATVTTCHIFTKDLAFYTKNADLIVIAVGKPNLLTAEMVKEGSIIVDVGINKLPDGKLVGDVDFENVSKKVKYITPVPGGVGPMTVAALLRNVVRAQERNQKETS
jgi:methylenetetrahydrofolate dehydrogenase (NADP+)/methenyltetrahydrofolate cyclohydrolase